MSGVYDGEFQLIKETPYERVWLAPCADDPNKFICKRETLLPSLVAEANAELLKATEGQKFGEGRLISRTPLDVWMKERGGERASDPDHAKWWLNHPNNAHWRTFRGTI